MASARGITAVQGNANDMGMFEDESFDLVVSNATLEHDKHFWLSVGEMRRVLAPGGLLIIGTPGYIENPERDQGRATSTYRVHYRFDYYRFSAQAFREVFFAGMEDVAVQSILQPPRIIGLGFKPGGDRAESDREAAERALGSGPLTVGLAGGRRPPVASFACGRDCAPVSGAGGRDRGARPSQCREGCARRSPARARA